MRTTLLLLALALPLLAQDAAVKKSASRIDEGVDWFSDGTALHDNERGFAFARPKRETLKVFEKAKAKAAEQKRLILWYVHRVTGKHLYRASLLHTYARTVFFSHPEVCELIGRKFVAMRAMADADMKEATGVGWPKVIEPAIVLMTPDGKIVHAIDRIRTFNPEWLTETLRSVLALNPDLNHHAEDASLEDLILGGDYVDAIAKGPDPYHSAILARRMRRAGEALKHLEKIDTPEGAVERGRVLLASGAIGKAKEQFRKSLEGKNARAAEARYHLGLAESCSGNEKAADAVWKELVEKHARSPWAPMGAINLVEGKDTWRRGPAAHGFADPFWPPAGACAGPPAGTRWAREKKDAEDVARRAVEFLLRMQRSHGGWDDARYSYWPDPSITPNVWVAVSALAAGALLEWRDVAPERIDKAVERAEAYFLDESRMTRGINEEVYADAFKLLYLVLKHARAADDGVRKTILEKMAATAGTLAAIQDSDGAWGHEYPNPFTTAAVMQVLSLAK
ncbi:MAG: tetratricopeptide repeat protein, partial [Planctomycetota bacterium]